tara:strand:- start:2165 stop:3250 length:1086 start_codon:yes stop_codon:yes gene_type:complete
MTTSIYQATPDFDFNKVHLANPMPCQGGTYFSKLLMGTNDDSLYIQTPKCKTKQGVIKTGKKKYSDLLFSNHNVNFINFINNLEEKLQKLIFDKHNLWFVNDDLEIEDIQNSFTTPIKVYKGTNYLVRSNLNQSRTNIENGIPIFNESETERCIEDITDKSDIICILEILGIKFTQRSFQLEINIKQIMIIENSPMFSNCLIKPDKTLGDKSEDITTTLIKDDTKEVLEDEPTVSNEVTEEGDELKGIELAVNNEEDNDTTVYEDTKEYLEDKKLNQDKEKDTLKELSEFEISLDVPEDESTMGLKKPVEIYMNLYTEALNKAKDAKKVAIEAFLAARNIKETYALNIESDDEEDELIEYN